MLGLLGASVEVCGCLGVGEGEPGEPSGTGPVAPFPFASPFRPEFMILSRDAEDGLLLLPLYSFIKWAMSSPSSSLSGGGGEGEEAPLFLRREGG